MLVVYGCGWRVNRLRCVISLSLMWESNSCSQDSDQILPISLLIVWLEISKLPLCAWNSHVLKKTLAMWGDVLFADEDESNNLAIGKVGKEGSFYDSENIYRQSDEDEERNQENLNDCGDYVLNTFNEGDEDRIHEEEEKEAGIHGDAKVSTTQDKPYMGKDVVGEAVNKRNDKARDEKPVDVNCSGEEGASHRNTNSTDDSSIPRGFSGRKFSPIRSNGSRNS
nr:RNA-directed DNA polymerase, eukaryota [Tanacetum cinerariifolium]